MEDLELLYVPNESLRARNEPVTGEEEFDLDALIDRMFEIMEEHGGVGLAAPQIGVNKRIFIAKNKTFINPLIKSISKQTGKAEEGCLSIPGTKVIIERPVEITINYKDQNGKDRRLVADKTLGRVIQHEMDHLNGVLISDYIDRDKALSELTQMAQEMGEYE